MPTKSNISFINPSNILNGARTILSIPDHIVLNPVPNRFQSSVTSPVIKSTAPIITFLNPFTISSIPVSTASPNWSNPIYESTQFNAPPSILAKLPINPSNKLISPCLMPSMIPPSSYPSINPETKSITLMMIVIGKNILPINVPNLDAILKIGSNIDINAAELFAMPMIVFTALIIGLNNLKTAPNTLVITTNVPLTNPTIDLPIPEIVFIIPATTLNAPTAALIPNVINPRIPATMDLIVLNAPLINLPMVLVVLLIPVDVNKFLILLKKFLIALNGLPIPFKSISSRNANLLPMVLKKSIIFCNGLNLIPSISSTNPNFFEISFKKPTIFCKGLNLIPSTSL